MAVSKRSLVRSAGAVLLSLALCALGTPAIAQDAAPAAAPAAAPVAKTTLDNMMSAFNGETNANARYLAFAKKADEEGYGKVASLFRAAARAEQVHFERHAEVIKALGGTPAVTIETPDVKSTKENLEAAMNGEIYENTVMYPAFVKQAEAENLPDAVDAFEDAMKAEGVHAALYKSALADLEAWKGASKDFFVCPRCGNVVDALPAMACPICDTPSDKFMKVV
jgi:rubrerythrin